MAAHTTPEATYTFVLRHIAQQINATNTEIGSAGNTWAKGLKRQFPAVAPYANRAREALGIQSIGRTSGAKRIVRINPEKYEALCASLGVVPHYNEGAIKVDGAKPPKKRRGRKRQVKAIAATDTIPAPFVYRGVRCRVTRSAGIRNGGYAWIGTLDGKYVGSGRGSGDPLKRGDMHRHLDALLGPMVPDNGIDSDRVGRGVAANPDGAVTALAELAWDVMAFHGITRIVVSPGGVDYDMRVVTTKTLTRGGGK